MIRECKIYCDYTVDIGPPQTEAIMQVWASLGWDIAFEDDTGREIPNWWEATHNRDLMTDWSHLAYENKDREAEYLHQEVEDDWRQTISLDRNDLALVLAFRPLDDEYKFAEIKLKFDSGKYRYYAEKGLPPRIIAKLLNMADFKIKVRGCLTRTVCFPLAEVEENEQNQAEYQQLPLEWKQGYANWRWFQKHRETTLTSDLFTDEDRLEIRDWRFDGAAAQITSLPDVADICDLMHAALAGYRNVPMPEEKKAAEKAKAPRGLDEKDLKTECELHPPMEESPLKRFPPSFEPFANDWTRVHSSASSSSYSQSSSSSSSSALSFARTLPLWRSSTVSSSSSSSRPPPLIPDVDDNDKEVEAEDEEAQLAKQNTKRDREDDDDETTGDGGKGERDSQRQRTQGKWRTRRLGFNKKMFSKVGCKMCCPRCGAYEM